MIDFHTDNMTITGTDIFQKTTSSSYKISNVKAKLVYRYENGELSAYWEEEMQ